MRIFSFVTPLVFAAIPLDTCHGSTGLLVAGRAACGRRSLLAGRKEIPIGVRDGRAMTSPRSATRIGGWNPQANHRQAERPENFRGNVL